MVTRMKTTIELPDELFAEAKDYAREHDLTLRELVVEGLRGELERRASEPRRVDFVFPSYGNPDDEWPGDVSMTDLIRLSYGDRL